MYVYYYGTAVVEQRYRMTGSIAIEKGTQLPSRGEDFTVSKIQLITQATKREESRRDRGSTKRRSLGLETGEGVGRREFMYKGGG